MKRYILSLLTVGSFFAAFAGNIIKVHGKITNRLSDTLQLTYAFRSVAYKPMTSFIRLDAKGNFNTEFEVRDPFTSVTITNGDQQTELVVQPGYDLALTLNGKNFDSTLHYEGKGEETANYMAKRIVTGHTDGEFHTKAQQLCGKDLSDYESALNELEQSEIAFLAANGSSLPVPVKEYFRLSILYNKYSTMNMYPYIHEMFKENSNSVKSIPPANYDIVKDIPAAFNDAYLTVPAYTEYLTNFYSTQLSREKAIDNTSTWNSHDSGLTLTYRNMPPETAEFAAAQLIYYSIKSDPIEQTRRDFETYKKHFPKSKELSALKDAIDLKMTIGPGKPEIDFDILTPEGKQMKLSDLKGKVVYIDFWSRGCAPCIGEMPEAKKVRAHFADKPVAFVYISLDKEDDVWKKAIKDFEVNGINTHVDNSFSSDLLKKYGVIGIPGYFLISKEGNFADVKYVERAGSPEKLIAQIETLLK